MDGPAPDVPEERPAWHKWSRLIGVLAVILLIVGIVIWAERPATESTDGWTMEGAVVLALGDFEVAGTTCRGVGGSSVWQQGMSITVKDDLPDYDQPDDVVGTSELGEGYYDSQGGWCQLPFTVEIDDRRSAAVWYYRIYFGSLNAVQIEQYGSMPVIFTWDTFDGLTRYYPE